MNLLKMEDFTKKQRSLGTLAVEDSRVITGQNPASGGPVAELVLQHLKRTCIKSRFSIHIGKSAFYEIICKIAITFQFPNHQLLLYTPV